MISPALSRTASLTDAAPIHDSPLAPARPLGGRRISFLAWGLAGAAGVALWVILLRAI